MSSNSTGSGMSLGSISRQVTVTAHLSDRLSDRSADAGIEAERHTGNPAGRRRAALTGKLTGTACSFLGTGMLVAGRTGTAEATGGCTGSSCETPLATRPICGPNPADIPPSGSGELAC